MALYNYIDSTGVIIPDTSTLQTDVENEYKAVFGDDLVVTPDTPQGKLIAAETLARDAVVRNNAQLANQINPTQAGGIFLASIWALTGGQPLVATHSTLSGVQLAGVAGTVIPAGSIAKTASGDEFETLTTVTLDGSGLATVSMQSVLTGAIACGVGELDSVVSGVLGWETVTNPNAAILGSVKESDEASRRRRRATLGSLGRGLANSVLTAVYNVDGVKSAAFRENFQSTPQTIDGITLDANSIYVCVDGGVDDDIAQALIASKSGGCGYTGDTTITTVEPISGQSYDVKIQRPEELQILVKVTAKTPANVSDPNTVIINAVAAWANGEAEGEDGLIVGAGVSPFEIGGAINRVNPSIYVKKVEVAIYSGSPVYQTTTIDVGLDQVARIQASAVQVILI